MLSSVSPQLLYDYNASHIHALMLPISVNKAKKKPIDWRGSVPDTCSSNSSFSYNLTIAVI
jgi:hypothetical protein